MNAHAVAALLNSPLMRFIFVFSGAAAAGLAELHLRADPFAHQ